MAIARPPRAPYSLRGLSWVFVVLFGALLAANALVLDVMSGITWRAAQQVEQDARDVDDARDLEQFLREYHRIGNLSLATHDPELQVALVDLEAELDQFQDELARAGGDPDVAGLLVRLKDQIGTYLETRAALARRGTPLDEVVRSMRAPFEDVLATIKELKEHHQSTLQLSQARAHRALRDERVTGIVLAMLLVLSLVGAALGIRRFVLRPIHGLQEAVRRFRTGDLREKAPVGALAETRELAERFNELTDAIARQRRDQLTFLAGVAHDLKNPLAGLKLTVQGLERDPSAATPERFRLLDRQLDRITRMVGDLLDSTRIEAGELELRVQRFDLRDAAQAVLDQYATTASAHRLSCNAPEKPVAVMGDAHRVEQVIGNLVSNAIKYSPGGGPIEVTVAMADGEAVLAVSDHGVGIPADEVSDVFLPFRRRALTAELAPGVGLGLSIVRRIVDAHGGRIEVESAPGRGSTFRVCLRAAAGLGDTATQVSDSSCARSPAASSSRW